MTEVRTHAYASRTRPVYVRVRVPVDERLVLLEGADLLHEGADLLIRRKGRLIPNLPYMSQLELASVAPIMRLLWIRKREIVSGTRR